jgi:hypothetical protein
MGGGKVKVMIRRITDAPFLSSPVPQCRSLYDDSGSDFASLESPDQEAIMSAQEKVSSKVREGDLPLDSAIEITNEAGAILLPQASRKRFLRRQTSVGND